MTELAFTVYGKPQPAGSKRAFAIKRGGVPTGQVAVVDANPKAQSWMQEIRYAARTAMVDAFEGDTLYPLLTGALNVQIIFYRARPASHYGTGRNSSVLKASAPVLPITAPDVDKTSRAVLDSLKGVVYRDDAQVTDKTVRKRYGVPERCEITIRPAA
jgi:Holliday junction resolvase RusA-like endonuclease